MVKKKKSMQDVNNGANNANHFHMETRHAEIQFTIIKLILFGLTDLYLISHCFNISVKS